MISKHSVRKAENYLPPTMESFRLVSSELNLATKAKLNIDKLPNDAQFLPPIVGPVSRFNAEGLWRPLHDQPKETRYVMGRLWTWTDWGGHEHSKYVDIPRLCYQRKHIAPPSEELLLKNNKVYSTVLNKKEIERTKHCINLFLELFGQCNFVQADFSEPVSIQNVNFEILKPGEHPFDRIKQFLQKNPKGYEAAGLIKERFQFFEQARPKKVIYGKMGYHGYVGFQYEKFFVFDNIKYGNAIYVFDTDSSAVISLTKKEILNGNLQIARIPHISNWKLAVEKFLK